MKGKGKIKFLILMLLIVIIVIVVYNNVIKKDTTAVASEDVTESEVIRTNILNTLSNSSYVVTGLSEKKELHATYYFSEIYFSTNQQILSGENILKYTNGEYLVAPYDCVITEMSLPDTEAVCTSKHYITISSTDTLKITSKISEDEVSKIYVGQEANIEIEALDNKVITGYVSNIATTATYSSSGSTFEVTVEFQNDGSILLGMSAKCSVILEKSENTIAVAKEAVTTDRGQKTVTLKNEDGTTEEITIETGIENDAYVEVLSGLEEGDIVIIEEEEESTATNNIQRGNGNRGDFQGMPSDMNFGEMPEMPSGSQMQSK